MNNDRMIRLIIILIICVIAITAPLWLPIYYVQLLDMSLSLGLTAMSFILLAGYCGMISFTQTAFSSMAAYVVGIGTMDLGLPVWVLLPLSVAASAFLSALFGGIAIRAKGVYFLMMTLALSQLFYGVGLEWESVTHGWNGIAGITRPEIFGFSLISATPRYYTALFVTVLCYLVMRRIVRSPFGLALQGIRDNPTKMAALGFNVHLYRFLAIVISGAFAGVGGVLSLYSTGVVSPHTSDLSAIVKVVLAALLGGVTRLEGGLIGAVLTILLISFTSRYTSRYWMVVGAVFMMVMLFLPNGILGIKLRKKS
ncbi:MAG: branched-chain amino acid ABC transporter permease [Spirochaetes bacterium]|nr:branched-chain amino acid ABC transporter permease [Spirochaetota bacterium]